LLRGAPCVPLALEVHPRVLEAQEDLLEELLDGRADLLELLAETLLWTWVWERYFVRVTLGLVVIAVALGSVAVAVRSITIVMLVRRSYLAVGRALVGLILFDLGVVGADCSSGDEDEESGVLHVERLVLKCNG